MHDVLEAASQLQSFCAGQNWRFAFIGGIANLAWGEVRTTADADISLFTSFSGEETFARTLLGRFRGRRPDALEFALINRVLTLEADNGIGLDVGFAGFQFEGDAIERSVEFTFGRGVILRVINAEDLIVMKAFAGRLQDWADVDGIARRQGDKLDWHLIEANGRMLAEVAENEEMFSRLMSFRSA